MKKSMGKGKAKVKTQSKKSPAVKAAGFDYGDPKAVLKAALETELRGRELYTQYEKTVKSRMAKEVFRHLASEELAHIEDIKAFMKSGGMGDGVDVSDMEQADSIGDAKTLFGKLLSDMKGRVSANDDDNKARDVSMQFEKNGYEYYAKAAKAAKDEKLRVFLEWLVEQEQAHYMFIRNAFEYMSHPDSWYASEEGWLLEG